MPTIISEGDCIIDVTTRVIGDKEVEEGEGEKTQRGNIKKVKKMKIEIKKTINPSQRRTEGAIANKNHEIKR